MPDKSVSIAYEMQ